MRESPGRPSGDEVWFSGTRSGSSENLRGVTLNGKLRDITNVPGGMWLQDVRNGLALAIAQHVRIGIRGTSPGATDERELGWFGWSIPRDFSRDGKKVLFEEEGEGGGPNYTVFVRDTDGSPPVRIGEGRAEAISPDTKWVITQPLEQGALRVVPTGAGEARTLTHDNIRYTNIRYLPDGKHLLAVGIEAGHGGRDYLIDVRSGDSKPITPEGTTGVHLSPDGRSTLVIDSEGKWGVWSLDGNSIQPIPGLDSNKYYVTGWTPDGSSIYVLSQPVQGDRGQGLPGECHDRKDGVLEDVRGPHRIRRNHSRRSTLFRRRHSLRLYLRAAVVRGVRGEGAEVTRVARARL